MFLTPGSRLPAGRSFPRGTLLLFQQSTAPLGWTKQTTHNDKGLRVVSGAASSGGSVAFSTVFAQSATGATTLTTAQLPSQTHSFKYWGNGGNGIPPYPSATDSLGDGVMSNSTDSSSTLLVTDSNSGGSHTHPMDIRVQYVDVIIAKKS